MWVLIYIYIYNICWFVFVFPVFFPRRKKLHFLTFDSFWKLRIGRSADPEANWSGLPGVSRGPFGHGIVWLVGSWMWRLTPLLGPMLGFFVVVTDGFCCWTCL